MRNVRSVLMTGAAVAAAAVGGAATADAATRANSSTSSAGSTNKPPVGAPANVPAHGSAAHEDAEKPVTGAAAAKAKAAAVKSLGGGTAGSVTTDFTGNGYEVDVTKNGTTTEVHMDKSFNVQAGPNGGHGRAGGPRPGGPPPGGPPPSGSGSSYGPPVSG
jgi:hypothetical protein